MRYAILAISLITCLLGIWTAGQAGLSRLLVNQARGATWSASLDKATYLSPSDPKGHYARAAMLWRRGQIAEATKEFENIVTLRPRDYVSWLDLGSARDVAGDKEGALAAVKEAVQLAPYYAQPRWELGKLLLDVGQYDEAFAELRRAATSHPTLLPETINLAWQVYDGDPRAVSQAIQPQTAAPQIALTRFFIKQGKLTEAFELFRATDGGSDQSRRMLLAELLKAERFTEAYGVWSRVRDANNRRDNGVTALTNSSFEHGIGEDDDPGFGWVLRRQAKAVRISQDGDQPFAGAQSLRLDFNGNTPAQIASQLVVVESNTRYLLNFAARTQDVVTGGLPVVVVTEASGNKHVLGTSVPPPGNSGWQRYTAEFRTGESTGAVVISIEREACVGRQQCPIFGNVWFDDFSLQKF